jgi:hypothetical protein
MAVWINTKNCSCSRAVIATSGTVEADGALHCKRCRCLASTSGVKATDDAHPPINPKASVSADRTTPPRPSATATPLPPTPVDRDAPVTWKDRVPFGALIWLGLAWGAGALAISTLQAQAYQSYSYSNTTPTTCTYDRLAGTAGAECYRAPFDSTTYVAMWSILAIVILTTAAYAFYRRNQKLAPRAATHTPSQLIATPPSPPKSPGPQSAPSGWFTDPFSRHELRHFDGVSWTSHVSDADTLGNDPPGPR